MKPGVCAVERARSAAQHLASFISAAYTSPDRAAGVPPRVPLQHDARRLSERRRHAGPFGQIGGTLGLEAHGHGTLGKILANLQQIGETNFYALGIAAAVLALIGGSIKVSA